MASKRKRETAAKETMEEKQPRSSSRPRSRPVSRPRSSSLPLTPFMLLVYAACRLVPCGRVTTYAKLAAAINRPGASRAVGNALRHNPFAPIVPCHRVVAANFSLGGFMGATASDSEELTKKRRLLKEEGVELDQTGRVKEEYIVALPPCSFTPVDLDTAALSRP